MTIPRPHNSKRVRPPRKGNRHQARKRIEAQMFAKSRQAFSESNNKGR